MSKLTDREKLERAEQLVAELHKRLIRLLGEDNIELDLWVFTSPTYYAAAKSLEWEEVPVKDGLPFVGAAKSGEFGGIHVYMDVKKEASPSLD